MTLRPDPVLNIAERVPEGPMRRVMDSLQRVVGRASALVNVTLLRETAGHTVSNAASGAGTAITATRTMVNLADAGVDNVRVVVRGKNSGAGTVTVQVYDVTNSVALASVDVVDGTEGTFAGDWTSIAPLGTDDEIEVRVIGDDAFDPVLYAVQLQGRTVQART